jgi:hypothetical protein
MRRARGAPVFDALTRVQGPTRSVWTRPRAPASRSLARDIARSRRLTIDRGDAPTPARPRGGRTKHHVNRETDDDCSKTDDQDDRDEYRLPECHRFLSAATLTHRDRGGPSARLSDTRAARAQTAASAALARRQRLRCRWCRAASARARREERCCSWLPWRWLRQPAARSARPRSGSACSRAAGRPDRRR